MKDAEVTDIKDNSKDNTSLTVDDLVMEIGKQHVEKMSLDRQIAMLTKLNAMSKQKTVKEIDTSKLVKSNNLYEENNRKLTNQLVIERNAKGKAEMAIDKLTITITTKDKELNSNIDIITKLTKKNELLSKRLKVLKPITIKKKKATIKKDIAIKTVVKKPIVKKPIVKK